VTCKYRERLFGRLLQAAHSPVDHEPVDHATVELGGERGKPAEGGDAVPTVVNDQHIPQPHR
jgi:hypothetical protein